MLEVKNLCKAYDHFAVKDVSFTVDSGYIVGFIGMNGAGKSTTLKSILNIAHRDSGSVKIFGMDLDEHEREVKERVSFSPGGFEYYTKVKLKKIADVYRMFYSNWNDDEYRAYMKKFALDENKKVFELSEGMRVKFALVLALSHSAELLFLDEPTSGLDPLARDEMLEVFQTIVEDGKHSIVFSTHITSDLDKCADYIIFIKDGRIISYSTKDDLIDGHALISGTKEQLTAALKQAMISVKEHAYGFKGLIKREALAAFSGIASEKPSIEDIMVYYNREEKI